MGRLQRSLERQWYTRPDWLWLFLPLSWLFQFLSTRRRNKQRRSSYHSSLPVIVIGNISVGGTGKTPTIISLARTLQQRGFKPVVVSRGYGAAAASVRVLPSDADAQTYGDEPVLIAAATGCPVVVGADRVAVVQYVEQQQLGDVILSDDGLQHYRLGRAWEIAVVDSQRRLGNGHCLPVGPLREPARRLLEVDAVLLNGGLFAADWLLPGKTHLMLLQPVAWRHVKTGRRVPLEQLNLDGAAAIAGIGNPRRFFATLQSLGFRGTTRAFPDHHAFAPEDFSALREPVVLMTEKDAVKVRAFAADEWWALVVEAQISQTLIDHLCQTLVNSRTS
jgi:tetraacyldisaccharide 4''-kinase